MTKKVLLGLTLMLILLVPTTVLSAHAQSTNPGPTPPADGDKFKYNSGGSTFIYPLMDKWRVKFNQIYPGIKLNYQSVGSGAGIKLFLTSKVDFAGTDAPLQTAQIAKAPPGTLTIPESMGAIVMTYNLEGVRHNGLLLTGDVIAKIYLGEITTWNDPAIVSLQTDPNIAQALKDDRNKIVLVHRSDGSGTTYAFTDYLSKVSDDWAGEVGKGTSVPWKGGIGGSGNAGVANVVKTVPDSLGYVEYGYATHNFLTTNTGSGAGLVAGSGKVPMPYAYIQNADGTAFLQPTMTNVEAAASSAISSLPTSDGDWSHVSIANVAGPNSYPISSFTYLLVNPNLDQIKGESQQKANDLVYMLYWMLSDGQQYAGKLGYAPLPGVLQNLDYAGLAQIKYNGQQIWAYP
ncbi:MAG: phosphate ABC transporter substrate-binding protein PstS [Nitrosotalea sp.]